MKAQVCWPQDVLPTLCSWNIVWFLSTSQVPSAPGSLPGARAPHTWRSTSRMLRRDSQYLLWDSADACDPPGPYLLPLPIEACTCVLTSMKARGVELAGTDP